MHRLDDYGHSHGYRDSYNQFTFIGKVVQQNSLTWERNYSHSKQHCSERIINKTIPKDCKPLHHIYSTLFRASLHSSGQILKRLPSMAGKLILVLVSKRSSITSVSEVPVPEASHPAKDFFPLICVRKASGLSSSKRFDPKTLQQKVWQLPK